VRDWTAEEHDMLRREVPRRALKTEFRGRPLAALAREVVALARGGLTRRRKLDRMGGDESHFINVLQEIAETGLCPAEVKLAAYLGRWNGSVDPVFHDFAY